ncbi:AAA family ATPase [Ancylothrix sp. C2]|uniref:hybrid sensor histidine kinase/response regulator n=1 Tax=Ancylothrix sp. D3o TaxID=2953691 RepID=UPI0021BA8AB9|nr:hybrid sensor histidine kinase/response regulator [Ancylothrix sp. D3o]MCT7950967.1 AAA family ATPase [Ancylothrix sp. D3o]
MTINLAGYQFIETLHNGVRTCVDRARKDSEVSSVIIKTLKAEYPTLSDITRLRNEYQILHSLNVETIIKPLSLENYENGLALILEDSNSEAINKWMNGKTLATYQFISIAIQLVCALAELHKNNIIHKDIKPQNIIINPITEKVKLIDFSIASRLGQENAALSHPDLLEGTLAYMSPEQTGRMNRTIDYRTDFYSLGVTFYEILTGQLPFQATDPLELVHSHIAKTPIPPHQQNHEIPLQISAIVMKLLAKNAEDRYQSAEGLKFDLETCLINLKSSGSISDFIVGSADKAGQLNIPQKLYGRTTEVTALLETFDRVASGTTELMLVSGYSGIGKTVLVNEVHKPIVRQRGYFIAGKFDQFKRNIPYASLIQAFQSLILQLLTEGEAEIQIWKEKLLSALGANGQIIIDVIPEVELIIGKQPSIPELGATESQNRFSRVFKQFIGVFTTKEHPLVVFLDDLQWADLASLKLIELLITDTDSQYLLLVGAYRDNEVYPTHPTIQTIEKIQQAGATVNNIVLSPLQLVDIEALIADTLNEAINSKLLAELLFNKTGGNPFFLTQLLKTLYQEDLLIYDLYSAAWQWNLEQIQAIGITDLNVVELVARNIRKLSEDTQNVLKLAACIGNTFNLEVLSVVNEKSSLVTSAQLWSALQAGLILPLSNEYKIPLVFSQEESGGLSLTDVKVDYKFLHDRVQQAAYSLIPDDQKKQTHLKIGQLLLQNTTAEERKENIFALVNQLNYGTNLLTTVSEKYELASLNLIAGQKAKAATAYETAVKYLTVGLELLEKNSWETKYDLTLDLYVEAAAAEYLNINFERAEILSEVVLEHAKTVLDRVRVQELQMLFCTQQNQQLKTVDIALRVLDMLGVSLAEEPPGEIDFEELADLPEMTSPELLAAMRILMITAPAAYTVKPDLFPKFPFTMLKLSIQYGNSASAAVGYALNGVLLCSSPTGVEAGYRFGKLGMKLVDQFNARSIYGKVCLLFNGHVRHWKEHARETVAPMLEAAQTALENGDIEWNGYNSLYYCQHIFFTGEPLDFVNQKQAQHLDSMLKLKQSLHSLYVKSLRIITLHLLDASQEEYRLSNGEILNEEEILQSTLATNNYMFIFMIYLSKAMRFYLFKDYEQSVVNVALAEKYIDGVRGLIIDAEHNFYYSLAVLAQSPNVSEREREQYLNIVDKNQEKMEQWAIHAPMNCQHKHDLVVAEKARVLGQNEKAIDYYERAIKGAKEQEYIQEEALANELAAEFQLFLGREKIAKTYMTDAYYGYIRWGAKAKVEDLEERYPQLLASILNQKLSSNTGEATLKTLQGTITATGAGISEALDLATVMKASQAISGEIILPNLLDKLMKILIENAGAQTGALILPKEGQFVIEAAGNKDEVQVLQSLPVSTTQKLPLSVLNYVARTQKDVVLNDASREEIFNTDSYITQQKPKSILCTPIIYQGKLTAILYLENNLTAGAFTQKRVEVLRMLSAQAAIALENAQLYANLEKANQQLAEYNHNLEGKVEERTQELQEKNARLEVEIKERQRAEQAAETANRAKSQFLANMSHELRTPLNGILGYAQILKRDQNLNQQQNKGVEIIHRCGEHLLTLINDVLDLSKIEAGKMELYLSDLHLSDFLQGIAEICHVRAQQKGISLIYEPLTTLPICVRADEKRLRQIIINLLGNGVKFTDKGGVTFKVERLETGQSLSSPIAEQQALTAKIRFQVEDTGIGIEPEELSKIFLPFEQTSGSFRQTEGTGLGLAISRQLVEMMGSELKVKSSPGKGSIFWFDLELPIPENWEDDQKETEKVIKSFSGPKKKVLVVDDRWENRSVLVNLLAPIGFELMEASDGQDGVNKALLFQPDCIIIDLVMPVMDGFEAVRQIRKNTHLKNVILIGTSASILSSDAQESCLAGCNAFLLKPIRAEELLECLGHHLNLQWIYEDKTTFTSQGIFSAPPSQIQPQEIIAPPSEEVAVLFDLAMKGELLTIEQRAKKLEAMDRRYAAFANHLIELAKSFEEDKLIEFVQQFR